MYIILIYDIPNGEGSAKVARKIFKTCKKYLTHIQKSVFEGEVTPALLMQLKLELNQHIRKERDSVIIFNSRNQKWLEKEFLGLEDSKTSNFF
ncbi:MULTISPECIES: CRISPR-associated endonuclease Cas2 [unclassified Listeria]|uniref:CRISPR-associated endonuclease Cas2 n=1 Tax=unclassified Listeria TaxID=2642072 RepID=UPI000B5951E6|nr:MULTISPECIES: CRISPR-associated endonuclease Cas2 [unclassified Listeria]